eukprot:TRINITY_DN3396_c0_g1_i2.p1 TRINITY_DN3396_c0_g1~~TRINITY_DN3396_c0_g1_i2.p1  ORF type:complete len:869 (+),score=159.46 TRINITY_DN3396_c0_g1_i2:1557-4163(+)
MVVPSSASISSFASVYRPTIFDLKSRLEAATSQKDLSMITAEAVSLVTCASGDKTYIEQIINLLQHERFRGQADAICQSLWFKELYKNVDLLSVLPLISWLYKEQASFYVPEEWPDHLVRDLQSHGLKCMRNAVVHLPPSVFGNPAPRLPLVTIEDDSALVATFVGICQDVVIVLHDLQVAIHARTERMDTTDAEAWRKTADAVQLESLPTHIRDIMLLADKATNCVVMIPAIGCLKTGKSTVISAAVGAQVTAIHTRACTSLPVMLQHCNGNGANVEISPAIIGCLSNAMAASPERVTEFRQKAAEGDAAARIEAVNTAFRECVDQQLDVSDFFPPPVTSHLFGLPPLSRSMYPVVKVPFRALQGIPETPGTLVLVDTPGLFEHSQYEDHPYRRLVFDVLAHSAAVVVLVPLDQIDAEQTVQLSTIVESRVSPTLDIYVVVTKVDDHEVGKSAAFETRLRQLFPRAVAILPLCAQAALHATLAIDAANAFLDNTSDPDPRLVCLLNSAPADSYLMTLCKRMYGTRKSLEKLHAKPLKEFVEMVKEELRTSGLPELSKQVFQHMSNKVALTSINSYTHKLCDTLGGIADQMYNAVHTASLSHEEQLLLFERLCEASKDLQSMQDTITASCTKFVNPFVDSVRTGVEDMFVEIQTHVSVLVRHVAIKAAEPLDKALTVEEVLKAAMTGGAQAPSIPPVTEAFWISCLPWVHYARLRDFVSMEKHFKVSQVQTEFQSCGAILQVAVASCISSLIQRLATQSEQLQVNLQAAVTQALATIVDAVQSDGFRVAEIAKLTVDEPPLRAFSVPEKTEDLLRVNKTFFSSATITNPEHIRRELLTQLDEQRECVVKLLRESVHDLICGLVTWRTR